MLDLYFGLDATGFEKATTFHPLFGVPMFVSCYSRNINRNRPFFDGHICMSQQHAAFDWSASFLCQIFYFNNFEVLVSILSHTFSTISSDAEAEAKFRRAVATLEGLALDAILWNITDTSAQSQGRRSFQLSSGKP